MTESVREEKEDCSLISNLRSSLALRVFAAGAIPIYPVGEQLAGQIGDGWEGFYLPGELFL